MEAFSVLLTLTFILALFLVLKKVHNKTQTQILPPGPWGLPLLGHLVSLGLNPHLQFMKWKQKYGPIIRCRFGSFPTVVLCDSKLIKEAFSMPQFAGRPIIQVYVENKAIKGIALSEGQYNLELRQFTTRKLKEFGLGRTRLEDQIQHGVSEFMDFVREKEGQPVKSEDVPCAHILRTLWSIMMTDELDAEQTESLKRVFLRIVQLGPVLSELAGFVPLMENMTRILSLGQFSLLSARTKELQEYYAFLRKLLLEKKRNLAKVNTKGQMPMPRDIMEIYMTQTEETTDESSPFHASHDSSLYFLGDIFGAGVHTTYTVLVWMLNYMPRNPEVQSKLQEEIDQVVGLSRLPSLSDQAQMPYADAVVHEVLRMSSPIPLALPHKTTTDVCFHGYTIKKDTMIFANTYGVHHDPEIWGDPHTFRPERWFGDSGKKLKSDHFLPFSTGRRICPGEVFGFQQLFLYVTTLFQQYSVNFHLGKVPEVKGIFGIFLEPSEFSVVFNPRKI